MRIIYKIEYINNNKNSLNNNMQQYEVNIDFDEASKAWMANKTRLSNCTYKYICGATTKKGTRCLNTPNCNIHKKK